MSSTHSLTFSKLIVVFRKWLVIAADILHKTQVYRDKQTPISQIVLWSADSWYV